MVPLDELHRIEDRRFELAVNVHSFSEMSEGAIDGWLELLERLEVPWLLIVPNKGADLLSMEEHGERRSFAHLLAARGYEQTVCEPVFADPTLREFMNVGDHFVLFRRRAAA